MFLKFFDKIHADPVADVCPGVKKFFDKIHADPVADVCPGVKKSVSATGLHADPVADLCPGVEIQSLSQASH